MPEKDMGFDRSSFFDDLINGAKTIEAARMNYIKFRLARDEAKKMASDAESDFRKAEQKLVEMMQDAEVVTTRIANGAVFQVMPRLHVSVTLASTQEVAKWLESRGYQKDDIVREELVPKRVREIVREVYEKEGKVNIPACLKVDDSPGITVTGWESAYKTPSAPEV